MATAITAREVADQFGTDPRTLRKFLRSDASGVESVGKGSRYSLPGSKRELTALRKRFNAWDEARKAPKVTESDNTPEVVIEDEAPEVDNSLDSLEGPTEDELLEELDED